MRIEPAYWSVDASHHISHICEYMKTTFRRLFGRKKPKKNGQGFALLHKTTFFFIEKTILYLLTVRK